MIDFWKSQQSAPYCETVHSVAVCVHPSDLFRGAGWPEQKHLIILLTTEQIFNDNFYNLIKIKRRVKYITHLFKNA